MKLNLKEPKLLNKIIIYKMLQNIIFPPPQYLTPSNQFYQFAIPLM
jgi:hypothetical protein